MSHLSPEPSSQPVPSEATDRTTALTVIVPCGVTWNAGNDAAANIHAMGVGFHSPGPPHGDAGWVTNRKSHEC